MNTIGLASPDIISTSHVFFLILVSLGVSGALGTGIIKGLHKTWKTGVGAGIGAFLGCIFLAICIANATGIFDMGDSEFQKDVGHHHGDLQLPGGYGR